MHHKDLRRLNILPWSHLHTSPRGSPTGRYLVKALVVLGFFLAIWGGGGASPLAPSPVFGRPLGELLTRACTAYAEEKSVTFLRVDVTAQVLPDGSMVVREDRAIRFTGAFRRGKVWIPIKPGTDLVGFKVSEGPTIYTEESPDRASQRPGTYTVTRSKDRAEVVWYFETTGGERTFTLRYRVPGAVLVHNDVAELYWKFFGEETELPVAHVLVNVELPPGATREEVRAWGHGPLHGRVDIVNGSKVVLAVDGLPARTFVEGRIVFPRRLVPGAVRFSGRDGLPAILREEGAWARRANIRRARTRADLLGGPLLAVTILALWFLFIWRRFDREYPPEFEGDYYRELPADYSPAELGVLWRFGNPGPSDLVATIFDLARRGYIEIEEVTTEKKRLLGLLGSKKEKDYVIRMLDKANDESGLADHEKRVLVLLFRRIGEKGMVSFDQIEEFTKKDANHFYQVFKSWQETVREVAERHQFFDPISERGKLIGALAGLTVSIIGILLLVFSLPATGIGLIVIGFVVLIFSLRVKRRSRRASTEFAKWKAFRRFLLDFSSLSDAPVLSLAIWEHYLVYAIALGVAKEVISQLRVMFPQAAGEVAPVAPAWFLLAGDGDFPTSLASLTSSLESTIRTAASAASSASGGGGGFSSGGGGGGGGGGTSFS